MKTNHFSCIFLTDFKDKGAKTMYRPIDKLQHSSLDFNQPMGLHMEPDNRWVNWLIGYHGMSLKQNVPDCFQVVQVMLPSLSVWH